MPRTWKLPDEPSDDKVQDVEGKIWTRTEQLAIRPDYHLWQLGNGVTIAWGYLVNVYGPLTEVPQVDERPGARPQERRPA
jgi:hypothetical protein